MTFRHKLSRRLSLLRDRTLLAAAAAAAVAACSDGGLTGSGFDALNSPQEIVRLIASSDNPTIAPADSTLLRAVALTKDGRRELIKDAEWVALDGGTLVDTVVGGQKQTRFTAKDPGDYRLVTFDRGKRLRDTTRVTVPHNGQTIAQLYVLPAIVSLAVGGSEQFFVYGRTPQGDSVAVAADLQANGGTASGLLYTAGSTPGTFIVIAKQKGGPAADTASVAIAGSPTAAPVDTPPTTSDPVTTDPVTTDSTVSAPAPAPTPAAPVSSDAVAEMPRVYLDTRYQPPTGRTIVVSAGGSLQGAIDAAVRGDVIELAAGATFSGNFVLPAKSGTGWIIIRSATSLPPEGVRVTPATAASYAKIVTPNAMPALRTVTSGSASHYRLMGLEIGSSATMTYAIVHLGDYDNQGTSVDVLPSDLVLDRVWIHGTSTQQIQRCVVLNTRRSAVVDSWLSDCHAKGFDTQAIIGWNGPGPFKIVNNYLEGAGENVMFGGADPRIAGLTPSDIEIRRNYFHKPLAWKSSGAWTVKNLFELKNSARVIVEENVFENNWLDAQTGFAIVLKSINDQGGCTWCVSEDITFRHNKIMNSPGGMNLVAVQAYNGGGAVPAHRMAIHDNVFEDVGLTTSVGDQRVFQLLGELSDIHIFHNTAFGENVTVMFDGSASARLVFRDNLLTRGKYGVFGSGKGEGNPALAYYAPGVTFAGNVLIGAASSLYPSGNYFPQSSLTVGMVDYAGGNYALTSSSPYYTAATDGRAPGADYTGLTARLVGVK